MSYYDYAVQPQEHISVSGPPTAYASGLYQYQAHGINPNATLQIACFALVSTPPFHQDVTPAGAKADANGFFNATFVLTSSFPQNTPMAVSVMDTISGNASTSNSFTIKPQVITVYNGPTTNVGDTYAWQANGITPNGTMSASASYTAVGGGGGGFNKNVTPSPATTDSFGHISGSFVITPDYPIGVPISFFIIDETTAHSAQTHFTVAPFIGPVMSWVAPVAIASIGAGFVGAAALLYSRRRKRR